MSDLVGNPKDQFSRVAAQDGGMNFLHIMASFSRSRFFQELLKYGTSFSDAV